MNIKLVFTQFLLKNGTEGNINCQGYLQEKIPTDSKMKMMF